MLIGIVLLPSFYWSARREAMKLPSGKPGLLGEHTVTIGVEGVRERTAVNEGVHSWNGIHRIVDDKEHIYLFIDTHMAHIIPKGAFATESEARAFVDAATTYWQQATIR